MKHLLRCQLCGDALPPEPAVACRKDQICGSCRLDTATRAPARHIAVSCKWCGHSFVLSSGEQAMEGKTRLCFGCQGKQYSYQSPRAYGRQTRYARLDLQNTFIVASDDIGRYTSFNGEVTR